MERVPRLVGLAAWAILVLGAGMYVTGSHLAAQRFMTQVAGPTSLPAQSDYVSQAYGQRLGNDAEMIARATQILDLAALRSIIWCRPTLARCRLHRAGFPGTG